MLTDCFPRAACRFDQLQCHVIVTTKDGDANWGGGMEEEEGELCWGVNRVFSVQFTCHFSDPADRSPIFTAEL